jgi:hypothetical protein
VTTTSAAAPGWSFPSVMPSDCDARRAALACMAMMSIGASPLRASRDLNHAVRISPNMSPPMPSVPSMIGDFSLPSGA